jgi:hypothetical protein
MRCAFDNTEDKRFAWKIFAQKYLEVATFTSKNEDIKTDSTKMRCEDGTWIMSGAKVWY